MRRLRKNSPERENEKSLLISQKACFLTGAEEETRTLTPVRELDPEPSVSTNFTTSAAGVLIDDLACFGKYFFSVGADFCRAR